MTEFFEWCKIGSNWVWPLFTLIGLSWAIGHVVEKWKGR